MEDKLGLGELLAAVNLGRSTSDGGSMGGSKGGLWAIFIVILIFAVIWLIGGGTGIFGGITKATDIALGTGGLGVENPEQEEVRRQRTLDLVDAEFYRKKIVNHEQLEDAVKCINKTIADTATITLERAYNHSDKGDFRLEHQEDKDVCRLQREIETLDCRKLDKEFKRVAFCADPTCPPLSAVQNVDGPAILTAIELLTEQISKVLEK